MTPNILAALAAAIVFVFILWLLRRGVLKEKYAVLWLFVSAVAAFLALVPGAMRWLADLVGVEIPANLLFFVTLVLLILVSVQLSYELSRHEAKIRRMAEEFALLEERVRTLENRARRIEAPDDETER
jgi:hypothetical protein